MSDQPRKSREFLINNDDFRRLLGQFVVTNNVLDLTVDLALCRFLKITSEEAHIMASGMTFGKKARLLRDLIGRSSHKRKAEIMTAFNVITGKSKRDILIHSLINCDAEKVTFIERPGGGEYIAKEHTFTLTEFEAHVVGFNAECTKFHQALGFTEEEIEDFGQAAIRASRKPIRSPDPPPSKTE